MSYFADPPTTEGSTTTQGETSYQEHFIQQVVTEKGEQWSDPQTLAKGYVHAQKRIKELEEIASQSQKQDFAKELLEQLRQAPSRETAEAVPNTPTSGEENTTPSPEDIQSLIETKLTEREKTLSIQQNLSQADKLLEEAFGTEANATVTSKAKELGLTKERLTEIAGESPSAFMALMGEAPAKQTNTANTSSKNTASLDIKSGERNKEYYSELRRKNPTLYMQPETQRQMLEDAERMGSAFYGV